MNNEIIKENETVNEDSLFRIVGNDAVASEKIIAPRYSYSRSVLRVFFRKKSNYFLISLFLIVMLTAFIIPSFCHYDEYENVTDASSFNLSPAAAIAKYGFSFKYLLGTGSTGNSISYGIFASARTSLSLAIICAAINMTVGIIVGAIWGYSKKFDQIMIVIYNIIANVPYLLLISVLVYIIGSGFWPFVFALTITGWLSIAYFFRTQVMIIRDREYNMASKCLGTRTWTMILKNILPYLISVIMTYVSRQIPSLISYEVFLSYMGLGLGTTNASLGQSISLYTSYMNGYPHLFWIPVGVLAFISISLYIVGQKLADAADPRTHM